MKKLLLASVVLIVPLAANAADVSTPPLYKAPPIPVTNWTGFYLGVYDGAGWGTSRVTNTLTGITSGDFGISGAVFGGTGGFNLQAGAVVFGVEGDGGWAGFKGTLAPCGAAAITCTTNDSWLSTVRGRLGWAATPYLLIYGTGGGAFGDVQALSNVPGFFGASGSRAGWSAGAGLEWMFAPAWSAKVEYLHYDLGNFVCSPGCAATGAGVAIPVNWRFVADTARVGLNYHPNLGSAMGRY